jgi:hypothetical protein
MSTFANDIEKQVSKSPNGSVFVPSDFLGITTLVNINNILKRLSKKGSIKRILWGVYAKPYYSELLGKELAPTLEDVVNAIARKNKWCIAPTGAVALNRIGLSTQIPVKVEYASTGTGKVFTYGNMEIKFLHRSGKDIMDKSAITLVFIQALKELGKLHVDADVKQALLSRLTPDQIDTVYKETKDATSWVFDVAKDLKRMAA